MTIRFIPGMGYQVHDKKGKHHSTHDTLAEAETAHEVAQKMREEGKGSTDPIYKNSKKNK